MREFLDNFINIDPESAQIVAKMNENLGRGYVQIGKVRGELKTANGLNHMSPPVDKYNRVYITLFSAGLGFLLPYNSFIMAVDYFQDRFPGTTIMFDMSMVYIVSAFVAVLLNNVFVGMLPLRARINFGYALSLSVLVFVAACEIEWDYFSTKTSYTINLVAIGAIALGCTIQQASYYGFTSMLPPRYTQAVMAGESAAGFWVSVNRISTKYILQDEKHNTIVFFCITIIMVGSCWLLHVLTIGNPLINFYLTLCKESRRKIVLEPTEDAGLIDVDACNDVNTRGNYGVLKIQTSPPPSSANSKMSNQGEMDGNAIDGAFSFANPVYEPTAGNIPISIDEERLNRITVGPSFKVEDVIVRNPTKHSFKNSTWMEFKSGVIERWRVAQSIYPYMVTIGLAYFVTLSLYPGIESEIVSCHYQSWMPVIMITIFNTADLFGKILASIPYEWSRSQLLTLGILRVMLVPLMLLCAMPRESPHITQEIYPMIFSLLLGLTNGIVGSIPMIQAPTRVREEHRELTGNIMTLSYNVGLTTGTLVAYLFDAMLGPQIPNICNVIKSTQTILTRSSTKAVTVLELTTKSIEIGNSTFGMISNPNFNSTVLGTLDNTTIYSVVTNFTKIISAVSATNVSIINKTVK